MAVHTTPITTTIMAIHMTTEDGALLRLMSWLSPVFPTGGFAYSAGLEQAAASGLVTDQNTLAEWLNYQLSSGSIRNDAILLSCSWQDENNSHKMTELSMLAEALAESEARRRETINQGKSFLEAAANWPGLERSEMPFALPVALGMTAARAGIALPQTLQAFLNAFVLNQLQASIRLSLAGQNSAAQILADLESRILETAEFAARATVDDLGSANFLAAISSMKHETLEPRLFLS